MENVIKMVLAALRTSEFWTVAAQVAVEVIGAPVPEEFKVFGWLYVGARIVGKLAKYIFPDPAAPKAPPPVVPIILAAMLCASSASAQERVGILDVGERAHVTANAGAMVLTAGDDWSGAAIGGTLLYNLHQKLSVFGGYDRGVPVNDVDNALDVWRLVGSLKVHPNAFVGFGYAWFDDKTEGGLAQFLVSKQVMKRLAIGGVYAHIFSEGDADDFEYVKVYLNYHLLGKE